MLFRSASPSAFAIDTSRNIHITGIYQGPDTLDYFHPMPVFGGSEVMYLKFCSGAVDVQELNGSEMNAYPIPFASSFTVEGTRSNGVLSVFDFRGIECIRIQAQYGSTLIPTDHLSPGIYLMHYSCGNQRFSRKVIKN